MTRSLASCIAFVASAFAASFSFAADPDNIVYDFSAVWCGPCQQMAPLVARLEREGLPIRKVDFDKEKELASKFNITSLPTFVLVVDGKEAHRQSGAMTETDLRRLVAKVPKASGPSIAQGNGVPNVSLGNPGPMPETSPNANAAENRASEQASTGSQLKEMFSLGRNSSKSDENTYRGNDTSLGEATPNQNIANHSADPMDSSVRIRVIIDGKINLGSGTIIHSQEGIAKILTCAHIFRGFNDEAKIEVDLQINNQKQTHIARLENFNEEADLGLISVSTSKPLPVALIAKASRAPAAGEPVVGIGCSAGDDPTREQIRVTQIDKYLGPHNIECTGLPVRGRSGGGLFNSNGEVVGVCIAADKEGNRGLYSGLLAVHSLLEENQLAFLYQEQQPAVPAQTPQEMVVPEPATPASAFPVASHEPAPTSNPWPGDQGGLVASTPVDPVAPRVPVDLKTGGAEVVVIIRDPAHPEQQNRVVIIHDASSKFMTYLDGELEGPQDGHGLMSQYTPIRPVVRQLRAQNVNNTQLAGYQSESPANSQNRLIRSESLQQTSLSTPLVPRRYVRSTGGSLVK